MWTGSNMGWLRHAPPRGFEGLGLRACKNGPEGNTTRRVDAAGKAVTSRKTGSAPKRRSKPRKLEPQPSHLPTPHRAENEAWPGPDPGQTTARGCPDRAYGNTVLPSRHLAGLPDEIPAPSDDSRGRPHP